MGNAVWFLWGAEVPHSLRRLRAETAAGVQSVSLFRPNFVLCLEVLRPDGRGVARVFVIFTISSGITVTLI
jgi:hypothetical protein